MSGAQNHVGFKPDGIAGEIKLPVQMQVHLFNGFGIGVALQRADVAIDHAVALGKTGRGK